MGRWDSREATISSLSVVGVGHKTPKRHHQRRVWTVDSVKYQSKRCIWSDEGGCWMDGDKIKAQQNIRKRYRIKSRRRRSKVVEELSSIRRLWATHPADKTITIIRSDHKRGHKVTLTNSDVAGLLLLSTTMIYILRCETTNLNVTQLGRRWEKICQLLLLAFFN